MSDIPSRIARLESDRDNIEVRIDVHEENDVERFNRLFERIDERTGEILDRLTPMAAKLDTLWDEKNIRKGSKTTAAALGASLLALMCAALPLVRK